MAKHAIRDGIRRMDGYTPGEQPQGGGYIKLNTNENPYPPAPGVAQAVCAEAERARLYPDPLSVELRRTAAEIYGLSVDQVIAGNGSDDILNILIRATANEGETVASFYPSYTLYRTLAEIQGAEFRSIDFTDDYRVPEDLDLSGVKILFLPNPNAPSGTMESHDTFRRLCRECKGLVVADEAYADFADDNMLPLLAECPNLVICRTFSKSYSLAGSRIGLGLASKEIVTQLMKIKDSYNLDRFAQAAAVAALRDREYLRETVEKVKHTRARLAAGLSMLGVDALPSQANFILARFTSPSAKELYGELKKKKILVRFFDSPRLDNCLRITVGTDAEIDAFLQALAELLGN